MYSALAVKYSSRVFRLFDENKGKKSSLNLIFTNNEGAYGEVIGFSLINTAILLQFEDRLFASKTSRLP